MRAGPSVSLVLLAACGGGGSRPGAPATGATPERGPRVASNILRADYAGSARCRPCHTAIYRSWSTSPMRRMTRDIGSTAIRAPFDGTTFRVRDDTASPFEQDGARFVRLDSTRAGQRLFRVTRVIGGRTREDFVGVDVTGSADPAQDRGGGGGGGGEQVLPLSFVYATGAWRYKGYSVMLPERPGMIPGPAWSRTCIVCHNTLPYATMLYDDLYGDGAPGYQGTVSDDLLPPARAWRVRPADEHALAGELAADIDHLGGAGHPGGAIQPAVAVAIALTRQRFTGRDLIEVGIGCEACHGGSRAHADDPDLLPSFQPHSRGMRVELVGGGAPGRSEWINRTCARCHTVLFSGYAYTWEGGQRRDRVPGGSAINSGEGRDFLLGHCSRQMACTACHDPHTQDGPARLDALAGPSGDAICTRCHADLRGARAVAAHTHHAPGGAGSACLACHMPKKNLGLNYELTRYHRIGSPTDPERALRDRPLECALCHADRTVEQLAGAMERWWGVRLDRTALRRLYGDLRARPLLATVQRGLAHEQATAIAALGELRVRAAVPAIAGQLAHPIPLVRFVARHALERILGAPVPVDVNLPAADVAHAAAQWLAQEEGTAKTGI